MFFAIAIVVAIGFAAVLHHMRSICEEEQVSEVTNGKYVAAVFHRDCEQSETVHVNLRKQDSRFSTDFMTGTVDEGQVLLASSVTRQIEAHWTGPTSLVISLPVDSVFPRYTPRNSQGKTHIEHIDYHWEDVTITYERLP